MGTVTESQNMSFRETQLAEERPAQCQRELEKKYFEVRQATQDLGSPLEIEDYAIQSMPDASPTKWHFGHTTWFFHVFVLENQTKIDFAPFHPQFKILFNSYYETVGEKHPRSRRGLLSRPTINEIQDYRRHVDKAMQRLFVSSDLSAKLLSLIEVGIHHEQQHQELILTDIKHVFASNPLLPSYLPASLATDANTQKKTQQKTTDPLEPLSWTAHDGGVVQLGHSSSDFSFDNESPRHQVLLTPYRIANRLVTCGEFLEFINDGGYRSPTLWLSDGWASVQREGWEAPAYWRQDNGNWQLYSLEGAREIDLNEPVSHVSYFEADAYARWSGHRLPVEAEWETAANGLPIEGNFMESHAFHPVRSGASTTDPKQFFGDLWEWTASQYTAYPMYTAPEGALGEYNGKFMCNQFVLRGGSCATPISHIRKTYRNFFPPQARWQFSGIRLAHDAS